MADNQENGAAPSNPAGASGATDNAPRINVLAQYVKDLSFENPGAPGSLGPRQTNPRINISINVTANRTTPTDIEVSLKLDASATEPEGKALFNIELVYAGVFRASNIPENQWGALAMVEAPRILFPFARQILADASRNGGFPPLMVDPVDFAQLYRERLRREAAPGGESTIPSPPTTLS